MGLGTIGILLTVVGAVLLTNAIELPEGGPVHTDKLGWILFIAGVVTLILLVRITRQRSPREPR